MICIKSHKGNNKARGDRSGLFIAYFFVFASRVKKL